MKYGSNLATMAAAALFAADTAHAQVNAGEPPVPAQETELSVTAQGVAIRAAAGSRIRAGVTTLAPTAAGAFSENAAAMTSMLAALRRAGVASRDIVTTSIQLAPQYRSVNGVETINGYQAINTVSVRFDDVKRTGPVIDALVAAGANGIDGPSLMVADPDAALDKVHADAVKRARKRAELYAQAAGMHVVRVVSIAEAGFDDGGDRDSFFVPLLRDRVISEDAGRLPSTPVQMGERKVKASVNMRFMLR